MDEQVVGMIRDSLERIETRCSSIDEKIDEHIKVDAGYWQKIDRQEGALSVWKWIAGLGGGSGALAALSQWFGKH